MSQNSMDFDGWLTKAEAARFLAVSEKTVARLAEKGEVQKAQRKREGMMGPPVCVYHPGDLERMKAKQELAEQQTYVMPRENGGGEVVLSSQVKALAPIVAALRMTGPSELKEPYFLTLKQAREVSGLPGSYLHEHFVKAGRAIKTGRGWRIARAELDRFSRQASNMSEKAPVKQFVEVAHG